LKLVERGSLAEAGATARWFATRNSWENITVRFERILEETVKAKGRPRLK
jgi:hypothetical protein